MMLSVTCGMMSAVDGASRVTSAALLLASRPGLGLYDLPLFILSESFQNVASAIGQSVTASVSEQCASFVVILSYVMPGPTFNRFRRRRFDAIAMKP